MPDPTLIVCLSLNQAWSLGGWSSHCLACSITGSESTVTKSPQGSMFGEDGFLKEVKIGGQFV